MSIVRFTARPCARSGPVTVEPVPAANHTRFILVLITALAVVAIAVAGCSRKRSVDESNQLSKRVVEYGQPVPKGGGRYKIGNPYKIAGRWYTPRVDPGYDKVGIGSWYGDLFHGRYTANGEIFDMDALTAAHPTLPLPSYVRVTNLQNGRSLVLRVNDRGPYAHDRIIDLSRASAHALGYGRAGTARVRVQYLGPAPLNGDDSLERRVYASQSWARHASLKDLKPADKKTAKGDTIMLAAAAKEAVGADPMVVGSIPKEDENSSRAAAWNTQTEAFARKEPTSGQGSHFVQAASFNNREFAEKLGESYTGLGGVRILPANVAGKTWYRVRVGPYAERHEADQALRAIVESGMSDARVVRN